jgi:hypothetical protein
MKHNVSNQPRLDKPAACPRRTTRLQVSGFGYSQIPADFTGEKFVDLGMPWHGGTTIIDICIIQ